MSDYRSDDEQIEALKNWWKDNGTSILTTLAIAMALMFGWRTWQDSQQAQMDSGSLAYQELLESVMALESDSDDIKIATVDFMAESLKESHPGSGYSYFAAFFKAKQAIGDSDFAGAEEELRWVLTHKPIHEIELVAELRLAKVLFAQDKVDEAMLLLDRANVGAFSHMFLELKGDMLIDRGDYQGAFDAYTLAEAESGLLQIAVPQTLAIKLGYAKSFL